MKKSEKDEALSPVKRALLAMKKLQAKVDALESAKKEPLAIIGMGCRFPSQADTPEKFWELLCEGKSIVSDVPSSRWDADAYYHSEKGNLPPGKTYTRQASFLSEVDQFDAPFFGISGREAKKMDPQQRMLLEVGWEAFERAGLTDTQLMGSKTGVFLGISTQDYYHFASDPIELNDMYTMSGNNTSVAAGRLAYVWGLTGPTISIDTACSSSLVSLHLAAQSLRSGECDIALTGGVALMLTPHFTIQMAQAGALSPDSLCKTFSADANGYNQGEGCAMIVLKRLSDAVRDDDHIVAVIRGSAINHDGRSSGLTVPSAIAQQNVVKQAHMNSGVEASDMGYIEAHGTGTLLGDPIEVDALGAVFQDSSKPLMIGSVKTNIGHLDSAAGIAGVVKAALALQHKQLPAHLHCDRLNPGIDWDNLPIEVVTASRPFPERNGVCLAGVSAFSVSGTNAHVVLESPPVSRAQQRSSASPERPCHIINLSAKNESALHALAARYQTFLTEQADAEIGNIAYSANVTRSHFEHRLSLTATSTQSMTDQLAAYCQGEASHKVRQGYVPDYQSKPRVAFLFTGQGSQYQAMGRQLYDSQPAFRATIDHCAQILDSCLDAPLLSVLFAQDDAPDLLSQTMYTQPALFTLEYGLAKLWQSWGIEPDVVIGHSVGEYVAACIAGVFSLEDALKLIAARGSLMQGLPSGGGMLSVMASLSAIEPVLAESGQEEVSVAAINGPESVVLSGRSEVLQAVEKQLNLLSIKTQPLTVSHAFHSPLMEPMLDEFRAVARTVAYNLPECTLISNVAGKPAGEEMANPEYWVSHVVSVVRFADGVAGLLEQDIDVMLEIGPKPVLLGMVRLQRLDEAATAPTLLPSLRENRCDWQQMLDSLSQFYTLGFEINWQRIDAGYSRHKVVLPTYPWQRQRYWIEGRQSFGTHSAVSSQQASDPPQSDVLSDDDFWQSWLYAIHWQAKPLLTQQQSPVADSRETVYFIFARPEGAGAHLARGLMEQGKQCVFVLPAREYSHGKQDVGSAQCVDIVTLDVTSQGDYQRVLTDFSGRQSTHRHILYLWDHQDFAVVSGGLKDVSVPDIVLDLCHGVLQLTQTLSALEGSSRLWLLTENAKMPGEGCVGLQLEQAPLWAMSRTIRAEHPELDCRCLGVDVVTDKTALLVLEELQAAETEPQLVYHEGVRYVERWARHQTESSAALPTAVSSDRSYLITGGLGGLGLQIALALVDAGARYLVLNSRRNAVSDQAQDVINQLRKSGTSVVIIATDVSDATQSAGLIEECQRAVPLGGIIHAAGILDDGVLLQQNRERFATVMAAKVMGAWNLDQATRNIELDFFVAFSSVASLVEEAGQGNYAAANAFLDALMHDRQARGLNSLCVNWGAWAEVGMAAELSFNQAGVTAIPPMQGRQVLIELIRQSNPDTSPQVIVQPTDWPKYLEGIGTSSPLYSNFLQPSATVVNKPSLRRQLQSLGAAECHDRLMEYLEDTAIRILDLDPDQPIDHYQGLMNMGLDSLTAVEFRTQLARDLESRFSATLLFNYPTLDLLRNYLMKQVFEDELAVEADALNSEEAPEAKETEALDDIAKMLEQALAMDD